MFVLFEEIKFYDISKNIHLRLVPGKYKSYPESTLEPKDS